MSDGTGLAEAPLGLAGFRVLAVGETEAEVEIDIETTVRLAARASETAPRRTDAGRDPGSAVLRAAGTAGVRRWRCTDVDCAAKTWTETTEHLSRRAVMTRRAGAEACHQVGANARPVSQLADELGVCWWTVMAAVIEHGTPLVDDPDRVGPVDKLGVDETSWLRANRHPRHALRHGLVDLDRHIPDRHGRGQQCR